MFSKCLFSQTSISILSGISHVPKNRLFCSVACQHDHQETLHELRESTGLLHAMIELANFTLPPWAVFTPLVNDNGRG